MPRPLLLLTIVVALTATPLRLAEAADDLARMLAEFRSGPYLDEVDGGVGDDSGESIKADSARTSGAMTAVVEFLPATFGLALSPPERAPQLKAIPRSRWPASSTRRHVLLQCFLC